MDGSIQHSSQVKLQISSLLLLNCGSFIQYYNIIIFCVFKLSNVLFYINEVYWPWIPRISVKPVIILCQWCVHTGGSGEKKHKYQKSTTTKLKKAAEKHATKVPEAWENNAEKSVKILFSREDNTRRKKKKKAFAC